MWSVQNARNDFSTERNWPNTNIEYIRNKKIEYLYSNIKQSVPNIRIFEYIRVTLEYYTCQGSEDEVNHKGYRMKGSG